MREKLIDLKVLVPSMIGVLVFTLIVVTALVKLNTGIEKMWIEIVVKFISVITVYYVLSHYFSFGAFIHFKKSKGNFGITIIIVLITVWFYKFLIQNEVPTESATLALVTSVAIGVFEEFYFRGVIFSRMLFELGLAKALLWSSILFSAVHIINIRSGQSILETVNQCVYAFGVGVILGLIYWFGRSFIVISLIHIVLNFIFAGYYNSVNRFESVETFSQTDEFSISLSAIIAIVISIFLILKLLKSKYRNTKEFRA